MYVCFLQKRLQAWPHKHLKYCSDDSHAFKQEEQNLLCSIAGNFNLFFGACMDLHIQPALIISFNNTNYPGHFKRFCQATLKRGCSHFILSYFPSFPPVTLISLIILHFVLRPCVCTAIYYMQNQGGGGVQELLINCGPSKLSIICSSTSTGTCQESAVLQTRLMTSGQFSSSQHECWN